MLTANNEGADIQTVQLDIADDKLDTFLTIVANLKKDIVQGIRLKDDADYQESRTYFQTALQDIEEGKDTLLSQDEYNNEMKEFMQTL